MPRVESIREQVHNLVHAAPFRPFALNMENGDRIIIEHPENIAYVPATTNGKVALDDFSVISAQLRMFSTFAALTSVALVDRGEPAR